MSELYLIQMALQSKRSYSSLSTGDLKTRDNNTNEVSYRMVVPLNFCSVTIFNEKSPASVRPVQTLGVVQSKF